MREVRPMGYHPEVVEQTRRAEEEGGRRMTAQEWADNFTCDPGVVRAMFIDFSFVEMDRDIWKQRAESKIAIWRETLEKCVGVMTRLDDPSGPSFKAALSAARDLLGVNRDSK